MSKYTGVASQGGWRSTRGSKMDKKLLKDCIGAVIEAAVKNGWDKVLDLTLADVVEQLEQSEVQTPEQAVMLFADWIDCLTMY